MQAPQLCSSAAQHLWNAALHSEERQKHFERGGSKLCTPSAAPERAVQVTIVAWPCKSSAERFGAERGGGEQRWALRLEDVPARKAAALQLHADVKHNCKA